MRNRRCESVDVSGSGVLDRNNAGFMTNLWRPSSLANLVYPARNRNNAVFESTPTEDLNNDDKNKHNTSAPNNHSDKKAHTLSITPVNKCSREWGTVVSIVMIEARGLPDTPTDGSSHRVYCKIKLGTQMVKSKTVQNLQQPEWKERFQLHLYKDNHLKVSLWDKGKLKTFMGSTEIDLTHYEEERTHEIWKKLDDGYGMVHFTVTICNTRRKKNYQESSELEVKRHTIVNPNTDWKLVGQVYVKVVSAKGLYGRPSAYCTLEVDNERVRTHSARGSTELTWTWNKNFVFNVYDAVSTLDLNVYDSSLIRNECLGRIAIPLLRIQNGEMKWYALKDKSKRNIAKGNCPRVLLEMSFFWNPIKASLRVFQPKEVKYIKKPQKFDLSLVYKNLELTRDLFDLLYAVNEGYKQLFEWENQEFCVIALVGWVLFWYNFRLWTTPLFLLGPFFYFWVFNRHHVERSFLRGYGIVEDIDKDGEQAKTERTLTERIHELPELTLIITNGVDYIASLTEKFYNLASFKIPFLSYLTMVLLVVVSAVLYLIPFNYLLIFGGIYKFSRKYFSPERVLHNELEDFISRLPDTKILKEWKQLSVPEPTPVNGINIGHNSSNYKSVMY